MWGCVVSILRDAQNPTNHSPQQPALADLTLSMLLILQRSFPNSCDSVKTWSPWIEGSKNITVTLSLYINKLITQKYDCYENHKTVEADMGLWRYLILLKKGHLQLFDLHYVQTTFEISREGDFTTFLASYHQGSVILTPSQ